MRRILLYLADGVLYLCKEATAQMSAVARARYPDNLLPGTYSCSTNGHSSRSKTRNSI